jgi:hypothetical protein
LDREIVVLIIVPEVDRGPGIQEVREQNIPGQVLPFLSGDQGPISQQTVVVENGAQRKRPRELIMHF